MDRPVTIQPAPTVHGFCQHIIANHAGNWPPSEQVIAEEFVTFFKIDPVLRIERLTQLCTSLGISVSFKQLPTGLRGHNCVYRDKREIVITENVPSASVLGSQEHTLLHELREIMEYDFRRLQRPIASSYDDREQRAEAFGIAVRVESAQKTFYGLLDGLGQPEWTFGQFCIAVLMVLAMTIHAALCASLPRWEDQAERRYIRT